MRDLETQFIIEKKRHKPGYDKKIEFFGEIHLGDFEGEILYQNLNYDEMKGIVYSRIFKEIEKTLRWKKIKP